MTLCRRFNTFSTFILLGVLDREGNRTFETSETTRRTTRRHTPQYLHLRKHRCAERHIPSCTCKTVGWAHAASLAALYLAEADSNPSKSSDNCTTSLTTNSTPSAHAGSLRASFQLYAEVQPRFSAVAVSKRLGLIAKKERKPLHLCFVWFSEQTAVISLYSINWLVCITQTECVYCAVRTESLN
jgi:hypothetical protein